MWLIDMHALMILFSFNAICEIANASHHREVIRSL
jgi:hypothetical protein